jgi:hypothetical protein
MNYLKTIFFATIYLSIINIEAQNIYLPQNITIKLSGTSSTTHSIQIYNQTRIPKSKPISFNSENHLISIECNDISFYNINDGYGVDYPFVAKPGDLIEIKYDGVEFCIERNGSDFNLLNDLQNDFSNSIIYVPGNSIRNPTSLINNYHKAHSFIKNANLENDIEEFILREVLYKLVYELALCNEDNYQISQFVIENKNNIIQFHPNTAYSKNYIIGLYGYCSILGQINLNDFNTRSAMRMFEESKKNLPVFAQDEIQYYLLLEQIKEKAILSRNDPQFKNELDYYFENSLNPIQKKIISSKLKE